MPQAAETLDQVALRKWIAAGLGIPEVRALHGDAAYLLGNMIAKYTLAADHYAISVEAVAEFERLRVDLSQVYARSRFYGKRGGKNPFIYEHPVPAGVIRDHLLSATHDRSTVGQVLRSAGQVAVLLRTEDDRLNEIGLSRSMPAGWSVGDDPLARYHAAGIELSDRALRVKGAIQR